MASQILDSLYNLYEGALVLSKKYYAQYFDIIANKEEIKKANDSINELKDYYDYWKNLTPTLYEIYISELHKSTQAQDLLDKASNEMDNTMLTLKAQIDKTKNYIELVERKIAKEEDDERIRIAKEKLRVKAIIKERQVQQMDYLTKYGLRG